MLQIFDEELQADRNRKVTATPFRLQVTFVVLIIFAGLLLFSLLVGNMQTFLQSLGRRMEEYRTTVSLRPTSVSLAVICLM